MKPTKQLIDHMAPAIQELERANIPWSLENDRTNHCRLLYSIGGKKFFCTVSRTPSDKRSSLNLRADVRRVIKQEMQT